MRYFLLAYMLVAIMVVGIFGIPGGKFAGRPIRIFRDMKEQDVLRAEQADAYFANGQGIRRPVSKTLPRGFNDDGLPEIGGLAEYEFGGRPGYYFSGWIGDYYGTGMPVELGLTTANAPAFIRRGEQVFTIHCAPCHGASGDGRGMASAYGVPVAANPNAKLNSGTDSSYPDGRIFDTITRGKGLMGAYGPVIPVRDRWAAIAYVRTLQAAMAKQSTPAPARPPTGTSPP